MASLTNDEVKTKLLIIRKDRPIPDDEADQFVETADAMLSNANLGLGDELENQIWIYLAAHISCVSYPQAGDKKIGDSSVKREGQPSMSNLKSSRFGELACALDSSGILATLGGKRVCIGTTDITTDRYRVNYY